jgi:hypothetical protein
LVWHEHPRFEFHRLPKSGRATRLQAYLLELRLDIPGGFFEACRAYTAPLERVIGQELDVTPPAFAFRSRVLESESEKSKDEQSQVHD